MNSEKIFTGTLQMMKGYGYSQIEMCSPKGYAEIGFGPLAKMKTSDLRKTIADAGFGCISCHFGFGELADDKIDESIDFAKEMGLNPNDLFHFLVAENGYTKRLPGFGR